MEEMITITKEEYDSLMEAQNILWMLEAHGVDNWCGYSDSMDVRFLEFSLSVAYTYEIDWIQTRKGKSTIRKRKKS